MISDIQFHTLLHRTVDFKSYVNLKLFVLRPIVTPIAVGKVNLMGIYDVSSCNKAVDIL